MLNRLLEPRLSQPIFFLLGLAIGYLLACPARGVRRSPAGWPVADGGVVYEPSVTSWTSADGAVYVTWTGA